MSELLLIPLEDSVVFPNMTVTLTVETGDEEHVLLVPGTKASTPRSAPSPRSRASCGCPEAATPST